MQTLSKFLLEFGVMFFARLLGTLTVICLMLVLNVSAVERECFLGYKKMKVALEEDLVLGYMSCVLYSII
jgi:hypothetical protein